AVNGVSNKSPYPAQQLSINITTNQAEVPIMHQVSSTSRSFSLSWPPPEQPNGIILDYEIRYYDKVKWDDKCLCAAAQFGVMV
ncbi:Ephrin type-B receptor 1, partial [Xenoophorus captivus]